MLNWDIPPHFYSTFRIIHSTFNILVLSLCGHLPLYDHKRWPKFTADDKNGGTAAETISISVLEGAFRFLTVSLPEGTVGMEYAAALLVANQKGTVNFSTLFGSLPPGLSLSSDTGRITGKPTAAGLCDVIFSAGDGDWRLSRRVHRH